MLALPIFPVRLQTSIFGRSELNFRVRNGNGWTLALISTYYFNHRSDQNQYEVLIGDPYGNRTHVCGVRGRRLNRLTNGPSSERTAYRSFRPSAKTHSFRRSSSSSRTRFAGLRSELRGNCFLWSHLGRSCIPSGTWCAFRDSNPGPTD